MGMKWVLETQKRGAVVIVVDPKFNRTAAHADRYLRIRPGTDIAFLGAVINYLLSHDLYDKDYVERNTNALWKLRPDYLFHSGLFSGFDAESRTYSTETWGYERDAEG